MCGIVAVDISDISSDQIEEVKRVLIETEIRGRHSSGISWLSGNKVHTIKRPVPISDLMEVFDIYRCVDENNGHLSLIAHIRYSTSSLEYNQPITDPLLIDDQLAYDILGNPGDLALVHNGVISQKDPSTWDKEYGLGSTVGENDSELIYLSLLNNKHPLDIFPDSSMAVAYLNHRGIIKVFRNGSRPLWITRLYNGFIATSTEDIIKRSSVEYSHIFRTSPGVEYNLTSDTNEIIIKNMKDLQ